MGAGIIQWTLKKNNHDLLFLIIEMEQSATSFIAFSVFIRCIMYILQKHDTSYSYRLSGFL